MMVPVTGSGAEYAAGVLQSRLRVEDAGGPGDFKITLRLSDSNVNSAQRWAARHKRHYDEWQPDARRSGG